MISSLRQKENQASLLGITFNRTGCIQGSFTPIKMDVPHKKDTNETEVALGNATTPLNRENVEPPSDGRNLKRQFVPFFTFYYT